MNSWRRAQDLGFFLPRLPGPAPRVLAGAPVASLLLDQCRELAPRFASTARLVVILVGEDPASSIYVAAKERACARAGIATQTIRMESTVFTPAGLARCIREANADPKASGILLQLPLPGGADPRPFQNLIAPEKDVDGFLSLALGKLAAKDDSGFVPCTPQGISALLHAYGFDPRGKAVTVIGRSPTVGLPMALLLLAQDATVTVVHSKSTHSPNILRRQDLIVVASGVQGLLTGSQVGSHSWVIDVGIHRTPGGLTGDVSLQAREKAAAYSPVPGGVGPMTIAALCVNTCVAAWS